MQLHEQNMVGRWNTIGGMITTISTVANKNTFKGAETKFGVLSGDKDKGTTMNFMKML